MKIKLGNTYLDRHDRPHTVRKIRKSKIFDRYIYTDDDGRFWDEDGNAEPHNVMDNRPQRPLDLVKEVDE